MPFRREPFTDITFDSSKCVICQSDSDEALSAVTDRGRPTLLNFCRTRQWLVLADILLNPATAAVVISGVFRIYVRGGMKSGGLEDGSPPVGSRGKAPEVPQKLKLFCK